MSSQRPLRPGDKHVQWRGQRVAKRNAEANLNRVSVRIVGCNSPA